MKFGVLEYKNKNIINIGDAIQIYAVKELYKKTDIEIENVLRINYTELQTYDGDEVVLPICFPFYGLNSDYNITCFSKKIIPIFLSLSIFDGNLTNDDIKYLQQYEPIGCRDEFTANELTKCGVKAYLNGCMTLTLENSSTVKNRDTIFLVDVPEKFKKIIPEHMKEKCIECSHIFDKIDSTTDDFAEKLLNKYYTNAKLIITSRLHCAIPCYALGIPVIFIHSEFSYRFSWLEDFLTIYTPNHWDNINWQGQVISNNSKALECKKIMTDIGIRRIKSINNYPHAEINKLQNLYMKRDKRKFTRGPITLTIKYLEKNWHPDINIEYAIWGITQTAKALISYINSNYKNAHLVAVIDESKNKSFYGITPQKYDTLKNANDIFIFITADAANKYAYKKFDNTKKNPSTYFFCWSLKTTENSKYQEFEQYN